MTKVKRPGVRLAARPTRPMRDRRVRKAARAHVKVQVRKQDE
jgi:hypothetical protein